MDLCLILHYYSCTATTPPCTVIFETSRSTRRMAAILNLFMRSDQEDRYLKNVLSLADGQTVTKIVPLVSQILTNRSLILCNNSHQTWFSIHQRLPGPEGDVENRGRRPILSLYSVTPVRFINAFKQRLVDSFVQKWKVT